MNRNCLKAVHLVGRDRVGLASLRKFYIPYSAGDFYRATVAAGLRWVGRLTGGRRFTGFTGLYAFCRPYWRENRA